MNGYNLTRNWYNFKFENQDKCRHIHSDLYFYIIDQWNRLGQKKQFGLPTSKTMDAIGCGSYNTYKKTFDELVEFGFVELVKDSINQHQSRIVALSKTDETLYKALDKATDETLYKPTDTIDKQKNKETKEQINFVGLLGFINSSFGKKFQVINDSVKSKFNARLKDGYKKEDFFNAITNASKDDFHKDANFKWCTPEFFSRSSTLDKYGFESKQEKPKKFIVKHYNERNQEDEESNL